MLARVDKGVAWLSWLVAAALVLMLFVGPQVIAEDEKKPGDTQGAGAAPYSSGGGKAPDGKAVFVEQCGSCHTLEAAGTSGQSGPRLDGTSLGAAAIEAVVRGGRGGMPAFEGRLSPAEIEAVAKYVSESR